MKIKYAFLLLLFIVFSCNAKSEKKSNEQQEKQNLIVETPTITKKDIAKETPVETNNKTKIINEPLENFTKVDTVFFEINNTDSSYLGRSQMGDNGWGYANVINDSIIFAYDDYYFNMKLLNVNTGQIDTVVYHDIDFNFQSFEAIRGEVFRQTHKNLYRFDSNLNLKDSISVSESVSTNYAQYDFVEDFHSSPKGINIDYPKGFTKKSIKKSDLTEKPYLKRINDSTLQYGAVFYKVKLLPKNQTFIFHYKDKIYSVYDIEGKHILLIHYYDSPLKGY
ncbi:hypothetical protein [Bernardetia sp.]|uniref:hypothetical protein n=1 Tax=Bernardetia sp. TaxID=1937974 RepID=UPI0025BA0DEF|nr:hypothetical protein [Bernardetia sp.]